jgi:hypothetical protein
LYITVEGIKTLQAYFINNDLSMYDEETDERAVPKTWNISDDLGQIEYIFSDKVLSNAANKPMTHLNIDWNPHPKQNGIQKMYHQWQSLW